ncbi:MAG: IPT/TIG domain-containing protein [Chthoniobacterales bacterium]|nr:IPT/TIG domain-containing protein [Chthoniobacterales bacterium]
MGVTGPAQITGLSAPTAYRSGCLEITGANFGSEGETLIGGLAAPIADWQDTKIVAYVPEAAALGASSVQVVNSSGQPSSTVALTVTARQANGKVKWRFRQDGPYSLRAGWSFDLFYHLHRGRQ